MTDRILSSQWLPTFRHFLKQVTIASKEMDRPGKITLYTSQNILLNEIADGLQDGIHHFVNLKARQLGISTVVLVLDIFWLYMFPGLQGAFVCDTETNRENFRQLISSMMESLPKGYQIPVTKHDRTMLRLANGSVLQYMSAGKSKNSGLGRSRALNFVHASELGQWGDPKGYETLMDTLAMDNPNRLYIFESTALGFNLFYDCWNDALDDPLSKRAIFIGWWSKELYQLPETSREYEKWWGAFPNYTEYEAMVTKEVYDKFNFEIAPTQWAWYRMKADNRSEQSMQEEFPSLPNEAFQATGSPFFSGKRITADTDFIAREGIRAEGYHYIHDEDFLKTKLRRAVNEQDVELLVWERPQHDAKYVIGIDPAYGSSEEADRCVISVWRCFADKLVQVAEYASSITSTLNAARVLAHLAGEYRDCQCNLELQGGGGEVQNEINYLKKSIQYGNMSAAARDMKLEHVLDSIRWFLFRKTDSLNGVPTVYNWKSTQEQKALGLNRMNDAYGSGQLIVRSLPLLDEMNTLKRDGDKIGASGRHKDDRVMAAMLANYAWKEWIQSGMMADNRTFEREMRAQMDRSVSSSNVMHQIIPTFLREQQERRDNLELQVLMERPLQ